MTITVTVSHIHDVFAARANHWALTTIDNAFFNSRDRWVGVEEGPLTFQFTDRDAFLNYLTEGYLKAFGRFTSAGESCDEIEKVLSDPHYQKKFASVGWVLNMAGTHGRVEYNWWFKRCE